MGPIASQHAAHGWESRGSVRVPPVHPVILPLCPGLPGQRFLLWGPAKGMGLKLGAGHPGEQAQS